MKRSRNTETIKKENEKVKKSLTVCLLVALMLFTSVFSGGFSGQKESKQRKSTGVELPNKNTPISEGAVYYVATDGDNNNPGTFKAPWKTIQKAADMAGPGDIVYVRGGIYNEKIIMDNSGSDGAYITFENFEEEIPVIDGEGLTVGENNEENGVIIVKDKSYIRIKGFHITNYISTNEYVPTGIKVIGAGKNIEILKCKVYGIEAICTNDVIEDRNAHGIAVYGTNGEKSLDSVVIDGCEVYGNILGLSESVVLNGNVTNFRVTNNKVHDNDNIGIDFIGFEETAPSNDQARDGICSDNEVWNISSVNNRAYDDECADGIYVDGGKNILIERNKVWNCDIGIEAASEHAGRITDNITIRSNLVYGCKAVAGIAFGGYDEKRGRAKNIRIYNNTLYDNELNILIQFGCQYDTNAIKNNILYKGNDFDGDKENIVISNNITDNPLFVNEAGKDFHLTSDSTAIGAGIYDEFIGKLDLDSSDRFKGSNVDCGAYESRNN
ncbi:nitrous oxidase accessory protein NosD [Mobilisporobacter senegalensis]|uniref:Nitrous oxidase accessory protein NosD n=1 Tax=Mobilisporobacter senegalensis TaxID=1329262 RepID=A0A3N1XRF4_9FIRM|nr:nitrous oxidase accessory protein NosD [Mobilisporobacter senegalensis]